MSTATIERSKTNASSINFRTSKVGETIGALSFDPIEAERLAQLTDSERRRELSKNLEGFKGEVLDDIPVSHLYHYYYDHLGNVYNHSDRKPIHRFESQFDPRERDGFPAIGFKKATDLMLRNPNNVVLWYSPPGRATLDNHSNNPYSDVTFVYGQLYAMVFDGEKINGVAIKVDREGEEAIRQFMPDRFYDADQLGTDYDRIKFFLQNPVALAGNITDLIETSWSDGKVYGGKASGHTKQEFTVRKMIEEINRNFHESTKQPEIHALVRDLSPSQLTDRWTISQLYLRMIVNHPSMQKNGRMSLQGACGGSNVTRGEIEALMGGNPIEPLGSKYRILTQSENYLKNLLFSETHAGTSDHYGDYKCPHCGEMLSGESKTDKSSWRKSCDHCDGSLGC